MKILLCCFFCSAGCVIFAQGLPTGDFKMHYTGSVMSGVQIGCTDCSVGNQINASAYLINGIQFTKRLQVGVGIGADSYQQWKTMPLFLSVTEKLIGKKNGLLLQLNVGHAWAWVDRQQYPLPNFSQQGGLMIHPAVVYQIGLEKVNLYFTVGYKRQIASYSSRYEWETLQGAAYHETTVRNEFNRFVVQIGFGWK
ncbi:MAG: hypothetical protein ACK514_18940 [Bacteroidota bacterium]|jgi:hypothetical protein|nr:hypothetical protein [Cytophagales bacterium]MCE2958534.1 hypothetical protein [Flammeovirgaceae bacterium]MCZ8068975.1 hypothetical protein [Cytophagales bacterium]